MRIPPLLPVLLALAATGCSGSAGNGDAGTPPNITSLVLPASVSINASDVYTFNATISFTSSASPVTAINVASSALSYSNTITIQATTSVVNGVIPITFPSGSAVGTQADVEVSVTDEAGATSSAAGGSVELD